VLPARQAFLGNRATTIYSGTTEVQNNVNAKRIIGLLDHQ
jgi:alkylation response protein AidB-like acyl-CoA dehydrogenase